MTQVQTMTNPELNRALAELMGYTVERYEKPPFFGGWFRLMKEGQQISPEGCFTVDSAFSYAPDYCIDLAASVDIQTVAIKDHPEIYVKNLSDVMRANVFWDGCEGNMAPEGIAWLLTASPRERADAAYITLSQVKENSDG